MRTFDRYLLSHLLMLFGFFSLVLVAVYWVNRAIGLFDRLIAGGQNITIFLEFTALSLPNVIYAVLPVSALVATLYGVNRLTSDSEMVVAQTAGIGPWTLARPALMFGGLVCAMMLILAHVLVPASRTELGERGQEVSRDVTARILKEGEFVHPGEGVTVFVREISDTGVLFGLFLQDRRGRGVQTTYTAERALLLRNEGVPRLVMFNGMAQTLRDEQGRNLSIVTFEDFTYDLGRLSGATGIRYRHVKELSTPALLSLSKEVREVTRVTAGEILFEAHSRFAEPLSAAFLPVLALACLLIGGFSRMGPWRQILLAVTLAIVLKLLQNGAEHQIRQAASLWPLAYLPAALTALLAAFGLWRAAAPRRRWGKRGAQV